MKEIKFSLVFRDMWQSSGKYVPRVDQLLKAAPAIIKMGCFARVETNGGGFEQINLLFGENPNKAVRAWTKPFHEAGIQTHMLDRALNGLRMSPVPADVRKLFYKVKKAQGVDITRTFCGLNDTRNIIPSISYAKEAGMISQAAMSITYSPLHTVEYYTNLAFELIEAGADEICLKDMAGVARPVFLGKITKNIKDKYPDIKIQYHGHSGPGFSMATILEVCKAGCDYVDVAMEPLSWGTGHADVIAVREMLKDAGFKVPEINMEAYMELRTIIQEMMDDFLGLFIPARNRWMNSLLIGPGLPGGMMGSLMTDLETNLEGLNKWKEKNGQPKMTQDQLLIKLFDEVKYVWPMMGYPCLVTPFSQYVKNMALMNVIQMEKGKERWSMIADDIWDMMLGKSGKLPGPLAPELIERAKAEGREFFTGNPQDSYPDVLPQFRKTMQEKGWETGEDDEELFEYAMHPTQYEAYKSGKAKADFNASVEKIRAEKAQAKGAMPESIVVNINGNSYKVAISYDGSAPKSENIQKQTANTNISNAEKILSPLEGKFFLVKSNAETPVKVGQQVKKGDVIGYIEAMKTYNAIHAEKDGVIVEICVTPGDNVFEDDALFVLG